jgi:hypothetical protein
MGGAARGGAAPELGELERLRPREAVQPRPFICQAALPAFGGRDMPACWPASPPASAREVSSTWRRRAPAYSPALRARMRAPQKSVWINAFASSERPPGVGASCPAPFSAEDTKSTREARRADSPVCPPSYRRRSSLATDHHFCCERSASPRVPRDHNVVTRVPSPALPQSRAAPSSGPPDAGRRAAVQAHRLGHHPLAGQPTDPIHE